MTPAERLYALLPAIHRLRDADRGEVLRTLLAVLAEQAAIVERDIDRLYENWFIETCDEWAVPYIGDLLGVRGLHPVTQATFSHRARVANTIGHRRRKGTASMLEQLARDTTGWPARVVEYFQLLGTTQYMNHARPQNLRTPDLRHTRELDLIGTPFDRIAHVADVRHIDVNRGRHNIMNVGIFLWRLQACPITEAPPFSYGGGRFSFSQLGHDSPLFNSPLIETDPSHLAREVAVPAPIRRAALADSPDLYVGADRSVNVVVDGTPRTIAACNLSGWTHRPKAGTVAVDPHLGRLAFPVGEEPAPDTVRVTYYYGFSGEVGGGCYERPQATSATYVVARSGAPFASIGDALARWQDDGRPDATIEVADSAAYRETIGIRLRAGTSLSIRAANRRRPVLHLPEPLLVEGEEPSEGQLGSRLTLDGLLVSGHRVQIADGHLGILDIRHCTLVPGWTLDAAGAPAAPQEASVVATGNANLDVLLFRTITGRLDIPEVRTLRVADSLVDGLGRSAIDASRAHLDGSTVLGEVVVRAITEASNSIITGEVRAERKQEGCVRFCFLPPESVVPRRFRCQPDLAVNRALEEARRSDSSLAPATREAIRAQVVRVVRPRFTGLRYGQPGYGQLSLQCPAEIRTGADDQAEMGVFHHLQQTQREANLRTGVNEYLRVGLEVGMFYAS